MAYEIFDELLYLAVDNGASDIVVKSDKPGYLRLHGALEPVEMPPIDGETVLGFVDENVPGNYRETWEMEGQVDFAYFLERAGRFRVNAFLQRGTVSIVFRHIKSKIPNFEDLSLDQDVLLNLAQKKDGIVFLCGATGSGKSTTLACLLNWINHNMDKHVVTLEDPIEFNFIDAQSVFQQREVGIDAPSFGKALKAVLRQNPDIILIGEMRDKETFETALSAAETGHLVFTTLHAASAQQAITRLFEYYPAEQHPLVQRKLSETLRGVIVQKLLPNLEGDGRVPAQEILIGDSVARTMIRDGKFDKIGAILDVSSDNGSRSFNRELLRLIKAGKISKKVAMKNSPNQQALEMNLKGIFLSDSNRILGN
ncbi:PilT/PilU family type 4a pilus ATPase [Pelagicoccus sp. SDUM812003]|uniref:type IV pilus twitching motility protein PilT n=1 Tax=Pelagicoccus sp. SDUM812003 TaxID=3041267 RepID=UPI00280D2295|nr:PilT/PilU family type 4a pilus ATPase [Pelagicoccus sp. SDUM812003]MDQ8205078.1 PilT/PilU family type 4a pilus ATPase [Pelagicoccus sp. SDUM812003]